MKDLNKNEMILAKDDTIYLRLMTISDTENIVKWRNSPFVMNNFIIREPLTTEMHEDWIRTKVNEGKVVQFIVGELESNKDLGTVYFKDIDEKCEHCEFGIFLSEENAGKGIGYKAAKLAIEYMFNEFGFKYIYLKALEKNAAAIHTYEKCGFKLENRKELVTIAGQEETIVHMVLYGE